MTSIHVLCVILSVTCCVRADVYGFGESNNLVENPGFEKELGAEWMLEKGDVSRVSEAAQKGNYGILTQDRTHKDGGPHQRLYFADHPELESGKPIYLSARVKFLDNATETTTPKWYITCKFMYKFFYANTAYNVQGSAGRLVFEAADSTWNQIGGDLDIPLVKDDGSVPTYLEIWVRVEPQVIDFYVDSFAVSRIDELGDSWKNTLQEKINDIRKRDLTIQTTIPEDVNVADTEIKVEWLGPVFHWGTAIQSNHVAGDEPFQLKLKEYILKTFNWIGFIAGMKWVTMEPQRDVWKFTPVSTSVDWLVANGIDVRGHAYLWEIMENNPVWAQALVGQELKDRVMNRINVTGTFFKDKICEWDLCNEFLHQHFYEGRTMERAASLIAEEMDVAHAADPNSLLCINDYGVLRDSQTTSNQANLAFKLRDHLLAPIGCIGAQGHIREPEEYSLEKFLKRLQIISAPKLPVTISELSVHSSDLSIRAEILEQIMYAAYSEPMLTGVLYWGLSDINGLNFEHNTALVEGDNFTPNEAGVVMENLIRNVWTTPDYSVAPDSRTYANTMNVYNGNYKITTYVNGELRRTKTVKVSKGNSPKTATVYF